LDDDRPPPKGGDQAVPLKEAAGARVGAIFRLGEQASRLNRPRKQVVVGAGVWRIEPGRKHNHSAPSPIDRPFMRGSVHANRTT
jgi:hypothetical protein